MVVWEGKMKTMVMMCSLLMCSLLMFSPNSYAGSDCVEGDSISYRQIQDLVVDLSRCSVPVLSAADSVVSTLLKQWQSDAGRDSGLRSLPVLVAIAGAKADLALIRQEMTSRTLLARLKNMQAATPAVEEASPDEPK
jgi:hypothetical protein